MRILLINPPYQNLFSRGQPDYYYEEQGIFPPLGLLSVGAYLLEHSDFEVRVLDMQAEGLIQSDLTSFLRTQQPDLVGITCLTHFYYDVLKTARTVKEACPHVPVILGGYHTSLYPDETLLQPDIDGIVLGAGEIVFAKLCHQYHKTGVFGGIPGLLTQKQSDESLKAFQVIENIDELPFPARHLVPFQKYDYPISIAPPVTILMTSTGCPYKCIFCNTSRCEKLFFKSSNRVVDEIESSIALGFGEFLIQDENFGLRRERVVAIAEEIRRRKLKIVWSFKSRVNHMDRDLIRHVREAGCDSIHFGVESGDQKILDTIKKGFTLEEVRSVFKTVREEGLGITAAFMIGLPGETKKQIGTTIDFAIELEPNFIQFSIAIPLPGTEMYRLAFEKGLFTKDHWREYALNPTPDFIAPGWYENFTQDELEKLLHTAYRKFYLRPKYFWRRLLAIRNSSSFFRQLRPGLRILTKK